MVTSKVCCRCKRRRKAASFNKNSTRKDGLMSVCRECAKAYHDEWRKTPRVAERRRERVAKIRARNAKIINEFRSVPCTDCGKTFPPYCMDFDHVRGTKRGDVTELGMRDACSVEVLKAEIAKCEVVDAICHRIRTHTRKHCPLVQ